MLPVLGSRANAHARHRLSPREMLTGIKTSFTRDLRIGFLDYAQLTEPVNETPYNSPKPRTRGGVALYSLGNSKGSVTFMALDTGAEVAREKFHLPPMSDVVVSHLNALAAKDKKTISKEPAFLHHGLVMPDDIPTSDLDDTHFLLYQLRHHILQPINLPILLMIMILQIMGVNRRKQKSHTRSNHSKRTNKS